ncbi:hypothetical protein [Streptomyces sp. NBC_00691]|uniref:hypothetical protein n=1 Tax=Streptomyces sp. NBC_00691 TaxID=2903671 RepID=UPI002E30335D|nr:hypothetical protein [Streptomyces sp. NBC_00691]
MSPTRFASEHKWVYWGAIVILVGLVVTGLIRYESVRTNNETASKAHQLQEELVKAGYPSPDTETLERVLGTDGGPVCDDPGNALKTALWKIQQGNGATGPGMRPVITDSKAVEVERIVLQVYCPDEVDEFVDELNDLKTDDTVRR